MKNLCVFLMILLVLPTALANRRRSYNFKFKDKVH